MFLPSIVLALDFPEFYSKVKDEHLVEYLYKTTVISEKISIGEVKNEGKYILELRNRLGNIYSFWNMKYRNEIEIKLLNELHKILNTNNSPYVRMEAAIAIGIIRNKDSLKALNAALNDKD